MVDIEAYAIEYKFTEEQKAQTYVKQNTLLNKATVGVDFVSQLGGVTDIDTTQYPDLAFSPVYQASKAILQGVTDQFGTVEQKQTYIQTIKQLANPVQTILQEFRYALTVDTPQVSEGDAGTKALTFTLQLSKAPSSELTVNYQVLNTTTATAGEDYQSTDGVIVFQPGESNKTLSFNIIGDTQFEADEQVQVQFTSDALALPVLATATIVNDDLDPNNLPQTFQLTTATDNFTGAGGNDTFNATVSSIIANNTLNSSDTLNGGAGIDTLSISMESLPTTGYASANITPRLTSIEKLSISVVDDASSSGNHYYSVNAGSINEIYLTGDTYLLDSDLATFNLKYNTSVIKPDVILEDFKGNLVLENVNSAQSHLSQKINFKGYTGEVDFDYATGSLNLEITHAPSEATISASGSDTQITIVGDQQATLRLYVNSVDASDYVGNLNSSTNASNVLLGSGDDVLAGYYNQYFLSSNQQIDGGEGRDTLVVSAADVTADKAQGVRNFEILSIVDGGTAYLTAISEIDTVLLKSSSYYSLITLNGVSDQAFYLNGDNHMIELNPLLDTAQNQLQLILNELNSGKLSSVTANSYEIIQLNSTGTQTNRLALTANSLQQLVVTGDQALNLTNAVSNLALNAQTNTAGVIVKAVAGQLSFVGSSGDDALDMQATLEATDSLQGGEGRDRLIITDLRTLNSDTMAQLSGFEEVELKGNNAAFDASVWTGDTIIANTSGTLTIDALSSNQKVNVDYVSRLNLSTIESGQIVNLVSDSSMNWQLQLTNTAKAEIELVGDHNHVIAFHGVESNADILTVTFSESNKQTEPHSLYVQKVWNSNTEPTAYTFNAQALSLNVNGFWASGRATSENWITGSGNDDLYVMAGGVDVINAGSGDDWLTYFKSYDVASNSGVATLIGGDGNDVFRIGSPTENYGTLIIADLNLGSAGSSVDKLKIDYLDAGALTNTQIVKYTGTQDMNGKKIIVLNDGQTYTAQTAEAKIQGAGFGSTTKSALVFYADSEQKVHLAYDGNTASAVGNSAINELAILEGLTIGQVTGSLTYLDFI
ncbi:MAG TPA: Calx-beta domain-containing protein [Thiotrichales bacterium]|nr:Calx-beta domain-containing protein [Thiotrichales bacterium]